MKKKKVIFLILIIVVIMLLFSSCSFIDNNLAYIDSTEDAVNTVYTVSILGLVLYLWGREF